MNTEKGYTIHTSESEIAEQNFAIDRLLAEFHHNVELITHDPDREKFMLQQIKEFNPRYELIEVKTFSKKAEVLAQVVAGVYAPFIHGFTSVVLKNIHAGNLPEDVIVPPRDAIPIAVSIHSLAKLKNIDVNILTTHVNRNISGIANNQKSGVTFTDPLLGKYLDQQRSKMNGTERLCEVETGIYGTTSLIMASEFKKRGIKSYVPLKIYGLGPNISFVHAVLSQGKSWIADEADVDTGIISSFMVILDSMEELGMQNAYKSVERLVQTDAGEIAPAIESTGMDEVEIARVTNMAVAKTASSYSNIAISEVQQMIAKVDQLVEASKLGLPLTLTSAIPSMDSKKEHFANIRESGLFDYPVLTL